MISELTTYFMALEGHKKHNIQLTYVWVRSPWLATKFNDLYNDMIYFWNFP